MNDSRNTMTPRRRFLIGTTVTIAAIGTAAYLRPASLSWQDKMLRSLVDTIVPADEFAGALDANIDNMAAEQMRNKPKFKEQVLTLFDGIAKVSLGQHRKAFYKLNIDQREELLTNMLKHGSPQLNRTNLRRFRKFVLNEFYMSEIAHASLEYQLPSHYPAYLNQ